MFKFEMSTKQKLPVNLQIFAPNMDSLDAHNTGILEYDGVEYFFALDQSAPLFLDSTEIKLSYDMYARILSVNDSPVAHKWSGWAPPVVMCTIEYNGFPMPFAAWVSPSEKLADSLEQIKSDDDDCESQDTPANELKDWLSDINNVNKVGVFCLMDGAYPAAVTFKTRDEIDDVINSHHSEVDFIHVLDPNLKTIATFSVGEEWNPGGEGETYINRWDD